MTEPYPDTPAVTNIEFAQLDTQRRARTGDPEVVFGTGKTSHQVVTSLRELRRAHPDSAILATRLSDEALARCREELPGVEVDATARVAVLGEPPPGRGRVTVIGAGTADLPVVRECVTTVRVFGAEPVEVVDAGVAGLHRLLACKDEIDAADVVVAVAGMEAALPSVVGGLTGAVVIAVPTSVGYGWHMEGLTAWLATLNSCAPGVVTVNVDNGFGAGVAAARIARGSAAAAGAPGEAVGEEVR
ncbi:nickel pincer cofactor biosynthesis protein LarB [Haloechinothrix sp. LS1_15]|uniref:nickel pincer cofactor biosynthesis protein LarB n=1 Tax=Haloechinothrix sp. LS1_15 TaxID=2652248 RepID=UPI002946DDCC|nr:nickel pincer cofactor biosynthesis protein LarB [Haloechinothrix sp. LS1_15]MDV6010918.1 nickel pincer cofactor biosynthesis protein LarB [Haloechinothrix sp. LS1_15]